MGMKNVSVRWKMIILALITLIGTLAIGVLAVNPDAGYGGGIRERSPYKY